MGNTHIGVVSKNATGDRKTPFNAALNMLKLATKPMMLCDCQSNTHRGSMQGNTHAKPKLRINEKTACTAPKKMLDHENRIR